MSRTAIDLIKRFEGYRRNAAQLPDGRWTLGYGHTLTARPGAEVTEEDAEALLVYDLIGVAHALNEHVFAPLNQNQFDALASFTFNIGIENFRGSQVLKRLNEGASIQAACAMELWRKADFAGQRIVIDALVRRRATEKSLFLTPPDGAWVAAPSPVLRPSLDLDALELVPRDRPAEVTAPLTGERAEPAPPAEPVAAIAAAPEPVVLDADEGPVTAVAEAITNRLQTIFKDAAPEPKSEPRPEPEAQPQPAPEAPKADRLDPLPPPSEPFQPVAPPPEPRPEPPPAKPAPPEPFFKPLPDPVAFSRADASPLRADPEPLTLELTYPAQPIQRPQPGTPAELDAEAKAAADAAFTASPLALLVEELRGPDLFGPPPVTVPQPRRATAPAPSAPPVEPTPPPPQPVPPPPLEEAAPEPETLFTRRQPRVDDADFDGEDEDAAPRQRLGVVSLLLLAGLGLAFFAGGVFWALNGGEGARLGPVTPLMVGWLAGLTGIACFVVSVFLLLERLGRSESDWDD